MCLAKSRWSVTCRWSVGRACHWFTACAANGLREGTDDDRHDGVQQDPNIKTMLIPNFPIRIVDQDKLFLDNLQSLLVRMKAVEEALDAFRMFVSTQKELDKPLNLWLKYDKYPILAAAYKDLQDTVTRVNTFVTLVSTPCYTNHGTLSSSRVLHVGTYYGLG